MDDGPRDRAAMHVMLEKAVENGVGLLAATSHAAPQEQAFDLNQYRRRLDEANAYCRSRGWSLKLVGGCEILWCDRVPDLLREDKLPTLGETRHILLEFLPDTPLGEMGRAAERICKAGCLPILAHVERYRALRRTLSDPWRFKEDHGLLYQMNCDALLTPRSMMGRRFVRRMLEEKAIDLLASDAHDMARRPVRMKEAWEKAEAEYGRAYAEALVCSGWKIIGQNTDEFTENTDDNMLKREV